MKKTIGFLFSCLMLSASAQGGDGHPVGLRGSTPLDKEPAAAPMPGMVNDDIRKARAFAMQPPVIPHQIENYQLDKDFNMCKSCHGPERAPENPAPMASVTHFRDRDNKVHSEISSQRYFCTVCHVPQMEAKAPVENTYVDAERAVAAKKSTKK